MIRRIIIAVQTDDGQLYRLTTYQPNDVADIPCGYRSRSYAHWINCWDGTGHPLRGWVRIIRKSLNKITPLPASELYKPIPRELKNIVGRESLRQANEQLVKALIQYLQQLYGEDARNFVIYENANGVRVALKASAVPKKIYVARAMKVAEQGHLTIYVIADDLKLPEFNDSRPISTFFNHFFDPNVILLLESSASAKKLALIQATEPTTVTAKDHQTVVVLTPGLYLLVHPFMD